MESKLVGSVVALPYRRGLPGILVRFFAAPSDAEAGRWDTPDLEPTRIESTWTPIGSTITDEKGNFEIDYNCAGRESMFVTYLASGPETGEVECSKPYAWSCHARRICSSREAFLIGVDTSKLSKSGDATRQRNLDRLREAAGARIEKTEAERQEREAAHKAQPIDPKALVQRLRFSSRAAAEDSNTHVNRKELTSRQDRLHKQREFLEKHKETIWKNKQKLEVLVGPRAAIASKGQGASEEVAARPRAAIWMDWEKAPDKDTRRKILAERRFGLAVSNTNAALTDRIAALKARRSTKSTASAPQQQAKRHQTNKNTRVFLAKAMAPKGVAK